MKTNWKRIKYLKKKIRKIKFKNNTDHPVKHWRCLVLMFARLTQKIISTLVFSYNIPFKKMSHCLLIPNKQEFKSLLNEVQCYGLCYHRHLWYHGGSLSGIFFFLFYFYATDASLLTLDLLLLKYAPVSLNIFLKTSFLFQSSLLFQWQNCSAYVQWIITYSPGPF